MFAQKYQRLPAALASARRRCGLLQKSAAASAGIGQTVLCAIEKGRRTPENGDVLQRLARAYGLDDAAVEELLFDAAHDQLMLSLSGTRFEAAAGLLSQALLTYRSLTPAEVAGLVMELGDLVDGKKRIDDLALRAARAPHPKETAM